MRNITRLLPIPIKKIKKKAKYLNKKDCKEIVSNSRKVLSDAISKGGSIIRDFKNILGKEGNFQKKLNFCKKTFFPEQCLHLGVLTYSV